MAPSSWEVVAVAVVEVKVILPVPEAAGKEFGLAARERVDYWSASSSLEDIVR
jgi:hypothetical protein